MMENHRRPGDRPVADDLLLNGFWTSSRAHNVTTSQPASRSLSSSRRPSKSPNRAREDWPPQPAVEEEAESLKREISRSSSQKSDDPPHRGTVDQHPIILESHISAAEIAKLQSESRKELREPRKENTAVEDSGERRFIHLTRQDSDEPSRSSEAGRRHESPPPIQRRRSRQDLPALNTKEPPPFKRSSSAYAYIPPKDESLKLRSPSTGNFLLPDGDRAGRDGYFDFSQSLPRKYSSTGSSNSQPSTPVGDKRRSNGYAPPRSRPTSPTRKGPDAAVRPKDLGDRLAKLTEPRRSPDLKDTSEHSRTPHVKSYNYYSSSDDDRASGESSRRTNTSLRPNMDKGRSTSKSNRHSLDPQPRHTSPLTSPKVSPSQLPIPKSRSRPVSPLSEQDRSHLGVSPRPPSRRPSGSGENPLPSPIPIRIDLNSPGKNKHAPQYDDQQWPPSFQPELLAKPVGSYRRHSQDVEDGLIAPLPPCPRTTPTRGQTDWLTLEKSAFNICPSCFGSAIAPTEFRSRFVPTPPQQQVTVCDFGIQPWYRIAWLLTRKEKRKDLGLMRSIANVAATTEPCLGKHEAVRKWHSVLDPATHQPIRNFDVCYSCVKCVEVLLPSLKGLFVRTDHLPPSLPRVCDLRFDSKRFVHYFDALETIADSSSELVEFTSLVKKYALIPECARDKELYDARWHMITQLPEFTVCAECWDEVVRPQQRKAIPAMFKAVGISKASCQLYSERMRAIFQKAVDGNDYKLLAARARERKEAEIDFQEDMIEQRRVSKVNPKAAALEIAALEEDWRKWQ